MFRIRPATKQSSSKTGHQPPLSLSGRGLIHPFTLWISISSRPSENYIIHKTFIDNLHEIKCSGSGILYNVHIQGSLKSRGIHFTHKFYVQPLFIFRLWLLVVFACFDFYKSSSVYLCLCKYLYSSYLHIV